MNSVKTVAIFCGSSEGRNVKYRQQAESLGSYLYDHHLSLVYGGGNLGLMGIVAESLYRRGGTVIGVLPEALHRNDVVLHQVEQTLYIVPTMHERKAKMYELADAFIALPGGIGTFEEILEVYTWLQLGYHNKPVALLNTCGFYDHFLAFLQHSSDEGFLKADHLDALIVEDDIQQLFTRLMSWKGRLSDKLS